MPTIDDHEVVSRKMSIDAIMAVLVERHGRLIADDVLVAAAKIGRGEKPAPNVVWPLFP